MLNSGLKQLRETALNNNLPKYIDIRAIAHIFKEHNRIARFLISGNSSVGRAPPCQGGCREFESRFPLFLFGRHGQVVRQRSAKPLFPSSNLGGASFLIPISKLSTFHKKSVFSL